MSTDRIAVVEGALEDYLNGARGRSTLTEPDGLVRPGGHLTVATALEVFEDQCLSRAIDAKARRMKADGTSFYTISSAGHEQNGIVGTILRTTDPCFLHYRSGALMMAQGRKDPESDPALATMLSICAAADDPVSGGRHKVWGSRSLWIPPQTSTIASHLPKAVGMAFAIGRARRLGADIGLPEDSVVCCSFGDASANHSSALTGIHAARYAVRRGNPMPIVFLCEDNGIGISVDTPNRWIAESFGDLTHLRYFHADGDMEQIWERVSEAIEVCRESRTPVFLHLPTVRLWGHAGSDIETAYRTQAQITATEVQDPLLQNARFLVEFGAADPAQLMATVLATRERVDRVAEQAAGRPHLSTTAEVIAPMAPYDELAVRSAVAAPVDEAVRKEIWGGTLPEDQASSTKRTMASHLSSALTDEMARHSDVVVFGEDVGRKGGVYYVTAGLQNKFGLARVFDTQLDETSILGLAQGLGMAGLLPVPEIQYLAYVHNAVDQIRGEAASLQFFSNGQFSNPMVIRIAGLAYQRGFGGHFHNDNSLGGLRDIPGLMIAVPSRGDDAARMLRGCLSVARTCGRVVVFLEPIALYHQKDLYAEGDQEWLFDYPKPTEAILPGEVGVYGSGEVLIVTYGNGVRMSLRAAKRLQDEHGIQVGVLDVRWINPLPLDEIAFHARQAGTVVVVDECRQTGGGIADAIVAALAEGGYGGRLASVRAVDSFVPLGPATSTVLVQEDDIVAAIRDLD